MREERGLLLAAWRAQQDNDTAMAEALARIDGNVDEKGKKDKEKFVVENAMMGHQAAPGDHPSSSSSEQPTLSIIFPMGSPVRVVKRKAQDGVSAVDVFLDPPNPKQDVRENVP